MGSNPISRSIFSLFFFPILLLSFEIKQSYFLDSDKIYSNDIFPTDDKFLVVTFNNRTSKQISKNNLLKLLKENHIEANTKYNVIYFYKISPFFIEDIELAIREKYESSNNITVTNVSIKPQSMGDISNLTLVDVDINSNNLKRANGVGRAHFGIDGKKIKTINFSYKIEGTQNVLVANKRINRGDVISSFNTTFKEQEISQRVLESIDKELLGEYEARVTIREGQLVDNRKVKKAYAIKKGDRIEAKIIEDGIVLTFALFAKENGYIGDTIKLENRAKKQFLGEITDKRKVEIR